MNVVTEPVVCSRCEGQGVHNLISEDAHGYFLDEVECSFCLGHGEVLENKVIEIDQPEPLREVTAHQQSFDKANEYLK